jgi:ABC-2 type transport system permease protein
MQLLLFSYAVTLDVDKVRIAVLNDDLGRGSYELIQRIEAASFVSDLVFVDRPATLETAIDERQVLAAIHFPADFSRALAADRPAVAQVLLDGRRANAAQITLSYLNAIAAETGAELGAGAEYGTARTETRHWFNPNLIYRWFVVPSLSGILAMMISLLVTALSIARERELGTFDQLLVSPARPIEIIVGKTVPAVLIGSFLGTVMISAGVFLFRIPFTGSPFWLAAGLVLFIGSMVGIGLTVSSVCQTQQQAILGTFTIAVPLVLISGFATPVENMPDWLQFIAAASPLKYYLVIVRGSFLKTLPPADVLSNLWPMALIAVITFWSAVVIVKRNLQ